jgi:hypothetical protein
LATKDGLGVGWALPGSGVAGGVLACGSISGAVDGDSANENYLGNTGIDENNIVVLAC